MIINSALGKGHHISLSEVEQINSGGSAWPIKFNPADSSYVAVGGQMTNKQVIVYSWNGVDTLTEVETLNLGHDCYGIDWHPDGDFLAVSEYNDSTNSINIYSWNGSDTLSLVETISITNGCGGNMWHPDGDYLAVATYNTAAGLKVYSWNGTDTLTEVESVNFGTFGTDPSWSNDGNYLAAGSIVVSNQLRIYSWNGTDTLTEEDTYNLGGTGYSPKWSSDDNYIFCSTGSGGTANVWVFAWSGTALTLKDSISYGANSSRGLNVYKDRYVGVGRYFTSSASQEVFSLYRFNKSTEELDYIDGLTVTGQGTNLIEFSPDGKFVFLPMFNDGSSYTVRVLSLF